MSDQPSERQRAWQRIANRQRQMIDRTLASLEREMRKDPTLLVIGEALEKLTNAAHHAFHLECQAAVMDQRIERDGRTWG